jgi:hypothetical protein
VDAVSLPPAISLPTAFGAPGTPLPAGQVVQALVLELIESDVFRLQLPQAVVDVKSSVPLTPGSTIALSAKGSGANAKLTIYGDAVAPAGPGAVTPVAGAPPGPAARHVIGEAIILARVPVSSQGGAAELGIARDAPSISPAQSPLRVADAPPQIVATPERAVAEAVRAAAVRQSGLAPLAANLEHVVQDGTLPAPVRQAAAQILSLRVPLDETLTATDVKQAFWRSGVLFEPRLASAQAAAPQAATPPGTGSQDAPAPANDLKAALLVFRQVVKAWANATEPAETVTANTPALTVGALKQLAASLGTAAEEALPRGLPPASDQAANLAKTLASAMLARAASPAQPDEPTQHNGPPPPYRGAPLAGQAPELASIAPGTTPHEAAERLLSQADGAIARQTMLQAASLPDQPSASQHHTDPNQRWTFEIPFVTPQGTGVAQFEVSRDGKNTQEEAKASIWRARFSLDLEPMGPVHAMVAIVGERASVTLWAERITTATRLTEQSALLNDALRAAELEPSDFTVRVGTPPVMRHAAPGRFMDRAT